VDRPKKLCVARREDTCGAVNAAFMIIGLKYTDKHLNRQATKKSTYYCT